MIHIRLLKDVVHLAPLGKKLVSVGGIMIPEQYQDDSKLYRVLGCGPKVNEAIKPGMACLAELYRDHQILSDGTKLTHDDQILAVWDDSP